MAVATEEGARVLSLQMKELIHGCTAQPGLRWRQKGMEQQRQSSKEKDFFAFGLGQSPPGFDFVIQDWWMARWMARCKK